MGFAASQARLLLLTSRKSDLEFRAQQITNAEMILAMQTEEIAREYSMKLSNQTIRYQSGDGNLVTLTAANFNGLTGYILQENYGTPENPDWQNWQYNETKSYIDKDGKYYTADEYNAYSQAERDRLQIQEVRSQGSNFSGQELIHGLNSGKFQVVDDKGEVVDFINANMNTVVGYDTSDDAEADAVYRQKTAALQVKEKRLQMELQQVEAQQKACESELDSVKKIMDKNIERTFKVFS